MWEYFVIGGTAAGTVGGVAIVGAFGLAFAICLIIACLS